MCSVKYNKCLWNNEKKKKRKRKMIKELNRLAFFRFSIFEYFIIIAYIHTIPKLIWNFYFLFYSFFFLFLHSIWKIVSFGCKVYLKTMPLYVAHTHTHIICVSCLVKINLVFSAQNDNNEFNRIVFFYFSNKKFTFVYK